MKHSKALFTRAGVAAALLALAAVAVGPALAEDKAPIKIGLAMPLSGSQATYGQDQVRAAQMGVEEINAAGGIEGHPIDLIVVDTQADPQLGIQAAKRFISVEQMPAFMSSWSGVVKAAAPIANDTKVLQLSVSANSTEIAHLGDYTYTTFPLADVDIAALARYSVEKLGKKRAAVLYINNESGIAGGDVFRKTFGDAGGEVVAYEGYDPKASDWTGVLLKLRAANPDMVHIQGLVLDTPQVIAQMRQLGLNMTVSSYSAIYNQKLIEQLGAAAEGVIATSLAPGVENPAVAKYVQEWIDKVGRAPNGLPYTEYLHDAPYIVAQVYGSLLRKGEALTGDSIRKEMLAIGTFDLPLVGKMTINENHTVDKPVYLMQVQNGKWEQLALVD